MIQQEWQKTYITTQTSTTIFSGKGMLHSVVINKPLASGVITLEDSEDAFAVITRPGTLLNDNAVTVLYDVVIQDGLIVVTAGANQNITITWQK